jgi:GT2 family glycosyltransferase
MIESGNPLRPRVSVIVCTHNRAKEILRSATSILASDYPDFELLVVDESDDGSTASALEPLRQGTSNLRYFHLASVGKARALNHARRHARGHFLALTDDDCEMAPDCLSTVVNVFQSDPEVAIIFGDVAAASHDSAQDQIPICRIYESKTIRRTSEFLRIPVQRSAAWINFGIGANMAIRSAALNAVEGWDPCIGPGEKFGSGDDHDLAFRLLRAGKALHFCPDARVVHHGVRQRALSERDAERVGRGFGASWIKHLKCGSVYPGATRTLSFNLVRLLLESLHLRRCDSAFFIRGWIAGLWQGLRHRVDKKTLRFEDDYSAF